MSNLRTTLLHHLPDQGNGQDPHFDWLLETTPAKPESRDVATWRMGIRIDQMTPGDHASLQRTQDHRSVWLQQREPRQLSEGRGRVLPCCHGRIQAIDFSKNDVWNLTILWNNASEGHYQIHSPTSQDGTVTRLPAPA